jgi:MerR family transcriptional regulator, mercuric resistance operon regulatory protein
MRTITSSRAENLPIGELSKQSGVNIEAIRYYERIKMLAPPPRTASGRRVYDSTDLRIQVFVRRCVDAFASALDEGPLALGFEAPMFVPLHDDTTNLTRSQRAKLPKLVGCCPSTNRLDD